MDNFLTQKQLKELVSLTSERLGIRHPSIIEKDYYVTYIIHSLSRIEDANFRLIFAGGTCLAKAHRIVSRMSEDVDFKIQFKNVDKTFSKSRLLKELKKFRSLIMSSLMHHNLTIGNIAVRNEGQYLRAELTYPTLFTTTSVLRPHLLLEFTLSEVRRSIDNLPITTLIEDTLENIEIFAPSLAPCVSIEETAIEKWVGLTRRIIAIEREYHHDDWTLVRHLYDLHSIKKADKINADFFTLAKTIINNDIQQFKSQHPEYATDPGAEIKQSLALLKNKPIWKERYQGFIETMVYNNTSAYKYESAMDFLENISHAVIDSL